MKLMITCPSTKKPVYTGISLDKVSFEKSEFINNATQCPHCKQMHMWNKKDAYLSEKD